MSIVNCIKELDALEKIITSDLYTKEKIAEWVEQISWELSGVMQRKRYDSDELQFILRKILKDMKRDKD